MDPEIDAAAETVLEFTNTVGVAAASLQNSRQAARTLRGFARAAARRPELVAISGAALIAVAAVLKVAEDHLDLEPDQNDPSRSQSTE